VELILVTIGYEIAYETPRPKPYTAPAGAGVHFTRSVSAERAKNTRPAANAE